MREIKPFESGIAQYSDGTIILNFSNYGTAQCSYSVQYCGAQVLAGAKQMANNEILAHNINHGTKLSLL
eukprot:5566317-Amphidinium_carterae.1